MQDDSFIPLTSLARVLRAEHNVTPTYNQLYSGYVDGTLPIERLNGRRLGVRREHVAEVARKFASDREGVAAA